MIFKIELSTVRTGPSFTYAAVGVTPTKASLARHDSDADLTGTKSIKSVAGQITPAAGRSAKTTSSVTVSGGLKLSLVTDVNGDGMTGIGYARNGANYVSHSPVSFMLNIAALELDGSRATLDFRLNQSPDGDTLQEISADILRADAGLAEAAKKYGFSRSREHLNLFRLTAEVGANRRKPGVFTVQSSYDRKFVTVDHEIDERDFEFDFARCRARYIGHLNADGKRVTRINITIDPGRTSDANNLIVEMLGREELPQRAAGKPQTSAA